MIELENVPSFERYQKEEEKENIIELMKQNYLDPYEFYLHLEIFMDSYYEDTQSFGPKNKHKKQKIVTEIEKKPEKKFKNTIKILRKKSLNELKHILQTYVYFDKMHYHWTWLQKKNDLIQLILDPSNNKFEIRNTN